MDGRGNGRYSIPIDVAPGPNGSQPSLSINYSSSGNNGKLGLGFSLGGIPTMARCSHSIADDGFVGGIEFDDDDALCFNGQRLALVSGVYGEAGSEYRTVRDPRSKIVLESGPIDDRLSTWVVYEPSGRILRFGGPDEKSAFGTQSRPFAWLLATTEDRFSNTVDYTWQVVSGGGNGTPDYWLEEVGYGQATVELHYDTRANDETHGYYAGIPYTRDQRLSQVEIIGLDGTTTLHTYDLEYTAHPQTQQSILTSIQKCDGAGACLPATTFEWSSVNPELESTGCDDISAEAFDGEEFKEPSEEDLRLLAPGRSVILDTFGDQRHEVLVWSGSDEHELPYLWGESVPGAGAGAGGSFWSQTPTRLTPTLSMLPPDASRADPRVFAQPWAPAATRVFGRDRSEVLFPTVSPEAGTDPVDGSDRRYDYWGVPFATDLLLTSNATYDAVEGVVKFASTWFEDGEGANGGKIYSMVPLDHDGNGLTDVWLCRGDGFKTARWVLGVNRGGTTPPFDFEWEPTDLQCSVHDELLTVSLHGDGRTSLLTVPAYRSALTVADFEDDYGAYLSSPWLQPISDEARDEYLTVDIDAGAFVPSGLPRDYFQRWHDRSCHNGVADAELGAPVYSAGMGADRIVDVNGDGYSDIVRAELAVGDNYANIAEIKNGLDTSSFPSDLGAFLCDPTEEQELVLRAYINTGNGFVARTTPLHSFSGVAHANYWINWRGAVSFDHNADGLLDFLLPGLGQDGFEGAILSSQADGDYFDGGTPSLPTYYPSYNQSTDDDWPNLFQRPGRAFATDDGHHVWFIGLQGGAPGEVCENGSVAQRASIMGANTRVTLDAITNGMGAREEFDYTLGPVGSVSGERPRGRLRKQSTVVSELAVQVGPAVGEEPAPMGRTRYRYEDPVYDDHGRGLVGYGLVEESVVRPAGAPGVGVPQPTTRRSYDLSYNADIADYPYAGRPERVETITYNETGFGLLQRVISCEDVDAWALVRPYQQQTWFSYPANVHNYTLTVPDSGLTSQVDCEDSSGVGMIREATATTVMNDRGMMTSRTFSSGNEVTTSTFTDPLDDEDAWFYQFRRTEEESCVAGVCETRTIWRNFNAPRHTLVESIREPDTTDSRYRRTSFGYNARGNLDLVRVAGFGGADTRATSTQWDADGVLPLSVTNSENHTSYVLSESASGTTFATVDPNGVTQQRVFDGFFRTIGSLRKNAPQGVTDGSGTKTFYEAGNPALGAVFQVQERVLGQVTRTQIGPTGKPLEVTFRGVADSQQFPVPEQGTPAGDIYYRNEYDAWGRLARTSHNAFVGNDPDYWTAVEYDDNGRTRRTVVVDAVGSELPETQERWSTTITAGWQGQVLPLESFYTDEENNTHSRVTDQKGRVVVAHDALGTSTCYDYGPFGRLDTVRRNCASGAVGPQPSTTYTYDGVGRLLSETDPAFGTRSRVYSPFDEVKATADAKGQVVISEYDDLGRRTLEIAPEGQSTWTYDGQKLGMLSSSTSPDGIGRAYRYDSFSRLVRETTELPLLGNQTVGDIIAVQYSYGTGSRVSAIEFEDGIGLHFYYDSVGYHRSTHFYEPAGEELVWGWEHSDANIAITTDAFGNAATPADRTRTSRIFDPATGRLEASTTANGGANVQAYSFGWTPAGDLDWRLDSHSGQAEEFEHDALHRLTESEVIGGAVRGHSYDVLGNLVTKDGVGSYVYDATGSRLHYTTDGTISTTYGHDANGAVESFADTNIAWTSFGKMREISTATDATRIKYDAGGARVIRESDEDITVTPHGLYERRYDAAGNLRHFATSATGPVVGEFRYGFTPGPNPAGHLEPRFDGPGPLTRLERRPRGRCDRRPADRLHRAPAEAGRFMAPGETRSMRRRGTRTSYVRTGR